RDVEVDLRPIEGAVPGVDLVGQSRGIERRLQLRLRVVPRGDLAEEVVRPGRQLRRERQAEVPVDALDQRNQPRDLGPDLFLRDEEMRVVLGYLGDAGPPRRTA